jgi:membrane protease YdiL (CAAX protease family)
LRDRRKAICIVLSALDLAGGFLTFRLLSKPGILGAFAGGYILSAVLELFFIGFPAFLLLFSTTSRWQGFIKTLLFPDTLHLGLSLLAAVSLTMVSGMIGIAWRVGLESAGFRVSVLTLPDPVTVIQWITALLSAAVIPAVCEETLFRGFVLGLLKKRLPENTAAIVSALLFAVCHLSVEGFPALLLIGFILAKVMSRRGNIWLPVLIHAGYNASSMVINASGANITVMMILLCAVIFFVSTRFLLQKEDVV